MGLKSVLTVRSLGSGKGGKREWGEKMGGLVERKLQELVTQKMRGEFLKQQYCKLHSLYVKRYNINYVIRSHRATT